MFGPNEEVGSSKNSEPLAPLLKVLILPFGSLLGDSMGFGAVLYHGRI